jgi:hypothetical protein
VVYYRSLQLYIIKNALDFMALIVKKTLFLDRDNIIDGGGGIVIIL